MARKKVIKNKEVYTSSLSLKDEIAQKKEILENARVELKKKFFGIDDVIDKFITSAEAWYLFPDLRTKPLVINLWGITGVGKTALVREFVKLVKKEKDYCEISSTSSDTYYLSNVLEEAGIIPESHAVVLIDEFQLLKTKNEKNEEIESSDLVDLWTFLSDGSFPVPFNLKLRLQNLYDDALAEQRGTKGEKGKIEGYYVSKFYSALKDANFDIKYDDVKNMTYGEVGEYLEVAKERVDTYINKVYSKLLIVVAGNLDEAFTFSKNVDDADTDADFMNEIADEIKITNIKSALFTRFRPEQISRLGNIHIIYPVLNKDAYIKLIEKSCSDIIERYKNKLGIEFSIDDELKKTIYKNGVFPSQGVRPVFSTMSVFLENPMSYFASKLVGTDYKNVLLKYNKETSEIICESFVYKVENTLDEIRDNVSDNNKTVYAVHEAGHAVSQALLFGIAPKQLTIKSSQIGVGGFCTTHEKTTNSKEQLLQQIQVTLGGRAAEEIVFGKNNITSGAGADNRDATSQAIAFVCLNAMSGKFGYWDGQIGFDMNDERQQESAEIINAEYLKVVELLRSNMAFLTEVADRLIEKGSVEADDFVQIASKYGHTLEKKDLKESIDKDYIGMYNKYKNKKLQKQCKGFWGKIKSYFNSLNFEEE